MLVVLCAGWLFLPLRQWMDTLQTGLLGLGPWGVVIFGVILFVTTFLPAPDWPLPIVAGYVYGVWALPLTYLSIVAASIVAFLIARYLARDWLRAVIDRRPKYRAIDTLVGKEGWQVVALLRLSPIVPFNLQNYALGVTAIPFGQYVVGTLLGLVPGLAIYVYVGIFGSGLGQGPSPIEWVLFASGAVATVGLSILVTWQTKAKFTEAGRPRARAGRQTKRR